MENVTFITALYNIQREEKGDGRKWTDYLEWFKNTLKMPLKMVIYISSDLVSFVEEHRPKDYDTKIIVQEKEMIPYAKYETAIATILENPDYCMRMKNPGRVECKIPFYNIIQYSKFKWLEDVANLNPFKSDYFFWMDAGISRFIFFKYSELKPYLRLPSNRLIMQHNYLLGHYPINEDYLWDSQCLMCGTMFGGDQEIILTIANYIDLELKQRISEGWINNEQILLAYIYRKRPDWFGLIFNNTPHHLCLFEKIFI